MNRRSFLGRAGVAAAGMLIPRRGTRAWATLPGGSLDPGSIPKYVRELVNPPAMPPVLPNYYEIAVRQFQQQVLPFGLPPTTVWSYGAADHAATFHYPAFTIEAQFNTPVTVKWINQLRAQGKFLPHLLPVDQTLEWANPPGGIAGRDRAGTDPTRYLGPVPMVPHVHGAHTGPESDGHPEAWWLPVASDIPAAYATRGSRFAQASGFAVEGGAAFFRYPNDQRATTLWYHDHTLGMTRTNVYAGPAGFYLIRGGPHDLPAGVLPGGPYEVPIAIQDRSFNRDGSLFYPHSRFFFDEFEGPYAPVSDIAPIWNPEFFGNCMVVNGRTWPFLNVERRRYRFRFLNGCNSRFLILRFNVSVPMWQIGAEGGFLPAPVPQRELLMAPAERADVIVDFSGVPSGATITLLNVGPDEPFGGGEPGRDFESSDPATTGQVMQFRAVLPLSAADSTVPPGQLALPAIAPLPAASFSRALSLNELDSEVLRKVGPRTAKLGVLDRKGRGVPLCWRDPLTETVALGSTEIWEFHNFTEDAHPIHVHLVQFQVVNRAGIKNGRSRPPEAWERGFKDTVIAYPGEVTRVKANFDVSGDYVWHCHIVEHEDNEMMRPYTIG